MQIVGYVSSATDPAGLLIAEEGTVRQKPLHPGDELTDALGERHCAGTIDDGQHRACDAQSAPYCDLHSDRWPCARCSGNCEMPIDSCHEEHAIYLAAFAPDTFKVGVTRSWRLDKRLHEQGADTAAHLRTVVNGRVAREIEAEMAEDIRDRVRVSTKIQGLHTSVDEAAWSELLSTFDPLETYDFEYGLQLDDRPVCETLAVGTVVGIKGRILVIENGDTTYAVDMRDLVGYELTEGASRRALQSSLGAFN